MQSSTSQWGRSSRWPAVAVVLVVICLVFSGCSRESREARYLASGKQMLAKKDYARAIIQFSNAAKMMPKDAEPRYQLALAYLAQRDFRTASGYLSTAVALNPKHDQARLKLAELYAASKEKKKVEEAQQSIRDLINAGQTSAEALDALAITEWRLGSPQDAEKHLEEAVAKFPDFRKFFFNAVHRATPITMHGVARIPSVKAGHVPITTSGVARHSKAAFAPDNPLNGR